MTAKKYLKRIEDLWSVYEMAAEKEHKMREQAVAQKRYRQQRRAGYKDLHRKWIGMDFTERPRIYKGCENCRHYSGRKCQKTQEELTMVCDEWEGN